VTVVTLRFGFGGDLRWAEPVRKEPSLQNAAPCRAGSRWDGPACCHRAPRPVTRHR